MAANETVRVWDKPYEISVYQKSKSAWEAAGEYMGETIRTKDSSRTTAMKRWAEAAKYKGNG